MALLPIIERELRVASRRKATYVGRTLMALIGCVVATWMFILLSISGIQAYAGQAVFGILTGLSSFYAFVSGALMTADSISSEKREGTIGLLFLTDLRGYDVVLGKMAAGSLNCFFGFLAVWPIMALGMLMGGVSVGLFWRTLFGLIIFLIFSLSAGVALSAISRSGWKAAAGTIAFLIAAIILPDAAVTILRKFVATQSTLDLIAHLSPGAWIDAADDGQYRTNPNAYWQSLLSAGLLTVLLLGASSIYLPRRWAERAPSPGAERRASRWRRWLNGDGATRQRRRASGLNAHPITWLTTRQRGRTVLLTTVALLWLGYLIVAEQFGSNRTDSGEALLLIWWTHAALKIVLLSLAASEFLVERRMGALELLLTTPVSISQILQERWRGIWRVLALPLAIVLLCDAQLFGAGLSSSTQPNEFSELSSGAAILLGSLLLDLWALTWIGLWLGLRARHQSAVLLGAAWRLFIMHWGAYLVAVTVWLYSESQSASTMTFLRIQWLWGAIGLGPALVFGLLSRSALREKFRSVCAIPAKKSAVVHRTPPRLPMRPAQP